MALGSWVCIAQQIAMQVVAKRDALDKFLRVLSGLDVRIAWVGWLLSVIVWSIRSLMDTLLRLVVLAQRALSREMEFQADLVAVSLTGSDELVHALHKLQAADEAWASVLGFAGSEARKGRIPRDLFSVHTAVIEKIARILDDESYGKVERASAEEGASRRIFKTGFAQPPQMWSTHPANADRENNAKRLYLAPPHDERSGWLLFDDAESLKKKLTDHLLGVGGATRATPEQTFQSLEERYSLLQYQPRYRGAYLGRSLTRHAAQASALYEDVLLSADLRQVLESLYSPDLSDDLTRLRDLDEEKVTLQAVQDKIYQATGKRLVHRGQEISRRELPAAIRNVAQEADQVRQRILAHDRRCRDVHLKAAAELGNGWHEYLLGLIGVLHYAEHSLAELHDADGLLSNVVAVATADRKVSAKELKRMVATANILHAVLSGLHDQKSDLRLDQALCARLGINAWTDMLEEFNLPPAAEDNINDWMRVIDAWVSSAAGALSALATAALEHLLHTEDRVARHVRERKQSESAPAPSRPPSQYATLLEGDERKRQQRLGLWDRFQTADGLVPGVARILVAGAIVGTMLGFGGFAGFRSTLSIYNGLGQAVAVHVAGRQVPVAAFSAAHINVELRDAATVETTAEDGRLIERFSPPLTGYAQHYVYNVAGASPMVLLTASHGSASEQPPSFLGAPRWFTASADVFFDEPPRSVKTKAGGATRTIMSGVGDESPEDVLRLISKEEERAQILEAHAKWDKEGTRHFRQWQALAGSRR